MFEGMEVFCYKMHYQEVIGPHLTRQTKEDIAKRISDLTLQHPIWTDRETNYADKFPELSPYVNVILSGLYLCTILQAIIQDLQRQPPPSLGSCNRRAGLCERK